MEIKPKLMTRLNLLHRRHQTLRNLPYFRLFVPLNSGSTRSTETASILLLACLTVPPNQVMPIAARSVTQASRASLCTVSGR